ncbi:MAG: AAA family ATPase [candidate division WOR-3 bacterium]
MKKTDLKSKYLEKAYKLHHLFEQRTELAHRLMDREFDFHYDKNELSKLQKRLSCIENRIRETEKELEKIISRAECDGIKLPIEDLAKSYNLGIEEKYIILNMFFDEISTRARYQTSRGTEQLKLLGYTPDKFIEKADLINSLLEKGLIQITEREEHPLIFKSEFVLTDTAIKGIIGSEEKHEDKADKQKIKFSHRGFPFRRFGEILTIRKPLLSFDQIVLDADKQKVIEQALYQARNLRFVMEEWGLSDTIKYGKGTTMLFYGPPGTGKTATCEAIAYELKKNLGIVNYSQILNASLCCAQNNLPHLTMSALQEFAEKETRKVISIHPRHVGFKTQKKED